MKAKELVDLIEHWISNFGDGEILCGDPEQTYLFGITDLNICDGKNHFFVIRTER